MRIEPRHGDRARLDARRAEIDALLTGCTAGAAPCAGQCTRRERRSCGRYCPDIRRHLSSDPEAAPLEAKIAPLVFEIRRLSVFAPCWSCEGHDGPRGEPWKIPRVWFYADGMVHVRLLGDGLARMRISGLLSTPWRVVLVHSDAANSDTTFCIEPDVGDAPPPLAELQRDADAIAANLARAMTREARALRSALGPPGATP